MTASGAARLDEQVVADPAAGPAPCPWPLTIATYNIHSAVGCDGVFSPKRIADVLAEIEADVVALQEVPMGGRDAPDVLAEIAAATSLHVARGPTLESADRCFGNVVLSRHRIARVRSIDLSFARREPRGALDADLDCAGNALRVVATHLGLGPRERGHQIERLLEVFDTDRMPVILMGDINEWFMWGRGLRRLTSHFQAVPAPPTFPSRRPIFALDRIWIRPRQRLLQVRVHASPLARLASDHLPLVARVGN